MRAYGLHPPPGGPRSVVGWPAPRTLLRGSWEGRDVRPCAQLRASVGTVASVRISPAGSPAARCQSSRCSASQNRLAWGQKSSMTRSQGPWGIADGEAGGRGPPGDAVGADEEVLVTFELAVVLEPGHCPRDAGRVSQGHIDQLAVDRGQEVDQQLGPPLFEGRRPAPVGAGRADAAEVDRDRQVAAVRHLRLGDVSRWASCPTSTNVRRSTARSTLFRGRWEAATRRAHLVINVVTGGVLVWALFGRRTFRELATDQLVTTVMGLLVLTVLIDLVAQFRRQRQRSAQVVIPGT